MHDHKKKAHLVIFDWTDTIVNTRSVNVDDMLFPGAVSVLQTLQDNGYCLAIATGAGLRSILPLMNMLDIKPFFTAMRGADTTRHKPDPLMIEEILIETGIPRENAWMVGDMSLDMTMAKNAGVKSIGFNQHPHHQEALFYAGADYVVDAWPALLDIILSHDHKYRNARASI